MTAPTERATAEDYFDQAGKILEKDAEKHVESKVTLAGFYARRGRISAAIDLLQRNADKAAPLALATAAADVVHYENVTAEQLQQAEQVLNTAIAAQKDNVTLLTALAVLKITIDKPAEAEAIYRRILAKDPNDFRACNNLAVLLALSGQKSDEALELINRAIDLAGPLPGLLDSRAVVHIARNEPKQALDDLDKILSGRSEKPDPLWLFHKAWR